MILHGEHLTYNQHGKHCFGLYVQAYSGTKPINMLHPRTLDCIYIKSSNNWQGGHIVYHIQTNRVITHSQIISAQISDGVVQAVHERAK